MNKSKIGNARQQDDNRIAVLNAKNLAECHQELSAIFSQAELQSADYQPAQIATYRSMRADPDSLDAQAWIKTCVMDDKATDTLREAIAQGCLPIWQIHDARETLMARAILDPNNVKYGIFKTYERPEPDMQGAKLWVKLPDWESFLARTAIPDSFRPPLSPNRRVFTRDDPAAIAPWWTVNEALAWVATRIPSYIANVGDLERGGSGEIRPYIIQAICITDLAESDEGKAFMLDRHINWPEGSILAHAGRDLLSKILAGEIAPMTRDGGQGRQMQREEFIGIGMEGTGTDWLRLKPKPLFSSAEIVAAFPVISPAPVAVDAVMVASTAGAENECRDWLGREFAADPDKQRTKADFQAAALGKFPGRLSVRGFIRAWDAVAPQSGRSKPGRKS